MIVVDTNIIANLYFFSEQTAEAERLLAKKVVWAAPYLWRSEFRNALAGQIRHRLIGFDIALSFQEAAERLMSGAEHEIASREVLQLVSMSTCSAYDCEFVALAQRLDVKLVTNDKKVLREFPETAISLQTAIHVL